MADDDGIKEISPHIEKLSAKEAFMGNMKLSDSLEDRIRFAFEKFEFSPSQVEDIADQILNADVDNALETSVPLHAWFIHCAAVAEEKREYFEQMLKTLEFNSVKDSTKKVTEQKGGVRVSELYQKTQAAFRQYQKIEHICKGLAETMKIRAEIARTRSANSRVGLTGGWDHSK